MSWGKNLMPSIRRIVPGLIAQEIISVQPMAAPKSLDIFLAMTIAFARYSRNSDGVIFKLTPSMGKDEAKRTMIIKVAFYQQQYDDYTDVCQLILDISGLSEDQAKDWIKISLIQIDEQIDDLTIEDSFNKAAAEKILETIKQTYQKD